MAKLVLTATSAVPHNQEKGVNAMLDEKDLQAIAGMLAQQKDDILQAVDNKLCNLERVVDKTLQQHTTRIELKIENEVSKKIETLFDGYKLTHEKQWEMERKIAELEQRIENLEIRAS